MPPDQFGLDGFEERLDGCIIIADSLSTQRRFEPMLANDLLIVMRTILAASIRVMDAFFGRCPEGCGHVQSPGCQAPFHPITDSPTGSHAENAGPGSQPDTANPRGYKRS
jgi:hypothetical protein